MMRWMPANIISSMQTLLAGPLVEQARSTAQIEVIRQTMLDRLAGSGDSAFPQIKRRILSVTDLQGLWYLRSDLMGALSSMHGELVARQSLEEITGMFEGLLPKSMFSRSALRRH
ncbi:MAG: hypothetical protein Q8K91_02845 [Hylemonella sp.]|nr:hypothetical protein [Hylemonella sp.]MDP1936127.1 hypothetical protein [Hylemonella sp.]